MRVFALQQLFDNAQAVAQVMPFDAHVRFGGIEHAHSLAQRCDLQRERALRLAHFVFFLDFREQEKDHRVEDRAHTEHAVLDDEPLHGHGRHERIEGEQVDEEHDARRKAQNAPAAVQGVQYAGIAVCERAQEQVHGSKAQGADSQREQFVVSGKEEHERGVRLCEHADERCGQLREQSA